MAGNTDDIWAFNSIKREANAQFHLAWPVSLTMLCKKLVDVISLAFVGHISSSALASVGLATVTANVTGNSYLIGLVGALTTLSSQAEGRGDRHEMGILLQRGLLIANLACVPICFLWAFSEPIIKALGQSAEIAHSARDFLVCLIPGIFFYANSLCIEQWLYAKGNTAAITIVTAIVLLLHPLWNYVCIHTLELGYLGAAAAASISKGFYLYLPTPIYDKSHNFTTGIQFACLLVYLDSSGTLKDSEFRYALSSYCLMAVWDYVYLYCDIVLRVARAYFPI